MCLDVNRGISLNVGTVKKKNQLIKIKTITPPEKNHLHVVIRPLFFLVLMLINISYPVDADICIKNKGYNKSIIEQDDNVWQRQ